LDQVEHVRFIAPLCATRLFRECFGGKPLLQFGQIVCAFGFHLRCVALPPAAQLASSWVFDVPEASR
jgi:hypothetical protein